MYVLAYDFGTGGIKASLYGADGACVASGFDAYPTTYPASGYHEQAPEDWWRATVQSTRRLTERLAPEQVKAIRSLATIQALYDVGARRFGVGVNSARSILAEMT